MKQMNIETKKWFIMYLIISLFLLIYLWDFNYRRRESLELILVTHLWVILAFGLESIFFYWKITKKSIGWCFISMIFSFVLGFFGGLVLMNFIIYILGSSIGYLFEYFVIGFFILLFNLIYMYSKANTETDKSLNSNILDE
jgi:hypothetical protein